MYAYRPHQHGLFFTTTVLEIAAAFLSADQYMHNCFCPWTQTYPIIYSPAVSDVCATHIGHVAGYYLLS